VHPHEIQGCNRLIRSLPLFPPPAVVSPDGRQRSDEALDPDDRELTCAALLEARRRAGVEVSGFGILCTRSGRSAAESSRSYDATEGNFPIQGSRTHIREDDGLALGSWAPNAYNPT
jgi:hypothetical protein